MSTKAWLLAAALVGMFVAQIGVPVSLIAKYERTLERGQVFRFRCAAVDPADPFRGRYVALAFRPNRVDAAELRPRRGRPIYLRLETDSAGFARLVDPRLEPHREGAYLKIGDWWMSNDAEISLRLPFDRYYLEERAAPAAEQAYREQVRSGDEEAWVSVRVLDGFAVLEELYLHGRPIRELLGADG